MVIAKRLLPLVGAILAFASSAQLVLAASGNGNGNDGGGNDAPEASFAMLLPLFGLLAIAGVWLLLARRRRRDRAV